MAGEYKSSIRLGVQLESEKDVSGRLQTLINTLQKEKINLDINIANSDVAKQLETLTTLANNFKNSLGSNVSLGNVNEIINQVTSAMVSMNDQVLKTSRVDIGDGITKQLKQTAEGIGVVKRELQLLDNLQLQQIIIK